jgi:flagellar protein FliJ
MNALQPLTALLTQTEAERDAALTDLQRAQSAQQTSQAQAEQLLTYRREYEQRWNGRFSTDGKIELVRCYQGFMERLTQAVESQARVAEQAATQLARTRDVLQGHEMRVASVRKLIERRIAEIRLGADRREQKQADELASRAAWNQFAAKNQRDRV